MQGIYSYIPEKKKHVCGVYGVAAILYLQLCSTCNVISPVKYALYYYNSTFRGVCAVFNMAVLVVP